MSRGKPKYTQVVQICVEPEVYVRLVNNAFDKRVKFPDYLRKTLYEKAGFEYE